MKITIIGTGYVGLVTGACFAQLGHTVTCVDIDEEKVRKINQGIPPIYEEGLQEILTSPKGTISATTSYNAALKDSDITFICVGTPSRDDGSINLRYLTTAVTTIARLLKQKNAYHLVVVKSTVLPGTTQGVVLPLLEKESGKKAGKEFGLAMNPEFLKEGVAIQDFMNPDRIVIGSNDEQSRQMLHRLYKTFTCPIVDTTLSAAEMIKYASNAFLATKISFINEIGNLCKQLNIDTYQVAEGMGLDKRIGRAFLDSGIGWGGSCLKGQEKILLYENGTPQLLSFEEGFNKYSQNELGVCTPRNLKALTWNYKKNIFEFQKVTALTKRPYSGEICTIHTSMGKTISTTIDHPMLIDDGGQIQIQRSSEIIEGTRIPVLTDIPAMTIHSIDLIDLILDCPEFPPDQVYCKPMKLHLKDFKNQIRALLKKIQYDKDYTYSKSFEFFRKNYLPLDVFLKLEKELPLTRADLSLYTAIGATTYVPAIIELNEQFWRFIGYYISEGHINTSSSKHSDRPRERIILSFNYKGEEAYIEDIKDYLSDLGIKCRTHTRQTSTTIQLSSRIFACMIDGYLRCGKDSYTKKLPDLIYTQPKKNRTALLSGLFRGDGSITFPNHTRAVVFEYGSISEPLIRGMILLLHSLDVVPGYKISQSAKSTAPAHFIRISSRAQIQRLKGLFLPPAQKEIQKRLASYKKIIMPTGHRRNLGITTVKVHDVTSRFENTYVYSMEVEGNHTFVTTDGLIIHNCFPKDIDALLDWVKDRNETAPIITATRTINQNQPHRLIPLLQKHLPVIKGKTIGLLGLAFKPQTDDVRESRAIPIATELLKAGARIKAYDPQAMGNFKTLFPTIEYCRNAREVLNSDAVLITTKWEEFSILDFTGTIVIDGRHLNEAKKTARIYEGVCW
jgi:UDPglucose 6-dehydrogenase